MLMLRQSAEEAASDLPALMAAAEQAVASVLHGEHAQRKTGAGEKFWQFREYTSYDRPQDIDWRQSGKTDEVFIRQKEWQTPQATIFWCARGPGMDFSSDKKLHTKSASAKILTLALSLLMTRAGEQIGLFGLPRTGRSEAALQKLGEALCAETPENSSLPDNTAYSCPKNSSLVQVGDFLSPLDDIDRVFRNLSANSRSGLVVQILDPAEIELPYHGRVIFEDPANHSREKINHVDSIRAAYAERIRDQQRSVELLAKENHWHYVFHRTDASIKDTLSAIWERLSYHGINNPEVRA